MTAALQIKNLPTGAGDDIKIDATYSKGNTKAVISTSGGSPNFAMFGNTGIAGAIRASALVKLDGVYVPGGDRWLKLTDAWGVRGAFNHNWDPYWSTSLWGSYARSSAIQWQRNLTQSRFAPRVSACANYHAGRPVCWSGYYSCNPDYQHCPGWCGHPLDSRQELDVLG